MSISFKDDMSPLAKRLIIEAFGDKIKTMDEQNVLFNAAPLLDGKKMSDIARAAKQDATYEMHDLDDIKTMKDGTKYRVTPRGWVKIKESVKCP